MKKKRQILRGLAESYAQFVGKELEIIVLDFEGDDRGRDVVIAI